nr:hypothetical protein B0A51_15656 [Rachicladosporium sp. CCFEE 5018]
MDSDDGAQSQAPSPGWHAAWSQPSEPYFDDLLKDFYTPSGMIDDVFLVVREEGFVTIEDDGTNKVFRALFSERFAEGQSLLAGEKELEVVHDPEGFSTMCRLLHHVPIDITMFVSGGSGGDVVVTPGVMGLAMTVDFYDCAKALHASIYGLLRHTMPALESPRYIVSHMQMCFVAAAYMLDQPEIFREATAILVKHLSTPLDKDICVDMLPPQFHGYIEAQRYYHEKQGTKMVSQLVSDFSDAAYKAQKSGLLVDLMAQLVSAKVWPLGQPCSLANTVSRISELDVPVLKSDNFKAYVDPARHQREDRDSWASTSVSSDRAGWLSAGIPLRMLDGGNDGVQTCRVIKAGGGPTSKAISRSAAAALQTCVGLCLDCLKGNETCRVPHPSRHDVGIPSATVMETWGFRDQRSAQEKAANAWAERPGSVW